MEEGTSGQSERERSQTTFTRKKELGANHREGRNNGSKKEHG
jgi:hypothetical protein